MGRRFKTEATEVNPWLTHVDVWPKAVQYCKAITLQLNINKFKYKNVFGDHITGSDVHCMPKEDLNGN